METETVLTAVTATQTRGGSTRYTARDREGREYTTFREEIGAEARRLEGRPVRIVFHEEQRGQYTNVYLDEVHPGPEVPGGDDGGTDPQEAAWRTAVDAAPWLVGRAEGPVDPDELYEKLKPFEERVEADIEASRRDEDA